MNKVLEGIRVIELSTYAAAPGAGRILADFGADVIKVEAPSGDPFRKFGDTVSAPTLDEENPCFQLENANKRGIALNLKKPEGKKVLFDLLKDAHIFLTNTRVEALKKMGLTYDELKEKFPRLIYGHISGYGFKGEDAGMPGFDVTAFWARGGGLADLPFKGNGPLSAPYAMGDHSATLALTTGLLGALNKQNTTGEGEYVLVSLFGVAVFLNSLMIVPCQEGYGDVFPKDRLLPLTPISNTYICRDGEGVTLTILDYAKSWPRFCEIIGRPDLVEDARFNDTIAAKKPENSSLLVPMLAEIFASKDRDEWVRRLKAADLPFSVAQHFKDIPKDQMAWENGYLSRFTFPNGHTAVIPNTPVQFKENIPAPCLPAPQLGEHTVELIQELGYSQEQIQGLLDDGVIQAW